MAGDHHVAPYDAAVALSAFALEHEGYIRGRIILGGGNVDQTTLREFLEVAYTLLVDGYRAFNMDMLTAVEKVNESLGLKPAEPPGVPGPAENTRSLQELERLMAG